MLMTSSTKAVTKHFFYNLDPVEPAITNKNTKVKPPEHQSFH